MVTRVSSYCHEGGCVAVTRVNGVTWLHRSDEPWYRGRWFDDAEFEAFTAGVKAGEFDVDVLSGATT